jgi:hypothetical protein
VELEAVVASACLGLYGLIAARNFGPHRHVNELGTLRAADIVVRSTSMYSPEELQVRDRVAFSPSQCIERRP